MPRPHLSRFSPPLYLVSGGSSLVPYCAERLGCMVAPRSGGIAPLKEGRPWGGDNDAFRGLFSPEIFRAYLTRLLPYQQTCLFVACPDVVADAAATAELYRAWGPEVQALGYPAAWVAQDGSLPRDIPECDAVFIGGSTEWKLGSAAYAVMQEAARRGLWIHVGRVNSARRAAHAARMGANSVDGTYTAFRGHQQGVREITGWMIDAAHASAQRRLL